ncbi:hypothetical protein [Kitasatospora sp. NPDC059571]|uniref:LppU/SCO3897 family protein n=1 Tax=Kitasatospora sp. NPDC059571 TaxID=3346871 RepID=UPI0036924C8E
MSTDPAAPVDVAALALGRRLGQGGQGSVHQVLNKHINQGAVDGGWAVVYKEYGPAVLPLVDAAALAAAAALPGRLTAAEGRWLCEKTAWPAAVVQRQGRACGFLMRAVPDRFHFDLRMLAGANAGTRRLASTEYLLNDDAYVAGIGLAISDRHRLLLLADLAATMDRLHRHGVTVGDVSPKNLLFSLAPEPACFLIDCDAMRLHGATVLPQAETPDWQVPAGEERATRASDVYKLALLAVRIFARDQTATEPTALAAVDPALGDLARASLDPDPARRPAPGVWAEQLAAAASGASTRTTATAPKARRPRAGSPARPGTGRPPTAGTPGRPTTTGTPAPPATAGATAGKVIGALAAVLALVLVIVGNQHSSRTGASRTADSGWTLRSATPYVPHLPAWTPTPRPAGTTSAPDTPTPTPTPTPTDPIATAEVGDCFHDTGSNGHADLSATTCSSGAFKVVRINAGSTDLNSCDGVADSDESVSSTRYGRVLCLSYQSSGGTAYHAHQGDCVFGAPGADSWSMQACQTGNFKVLATYRGTADHGKCDNWPHYNYWRTMAATGHSGLDVLLCLSMNYPDDAGYATVNECLLKSGNTFTNVGSCARSNVYVTGRTGTPDDPAFCGTSGSTWWRSGDYPAFGYTVCWRWR